MSTHAMGLSLLALLAVGCDRAAEPASSGELPRREAKAADPGPKPDHTIVMKADGCRLGEEPVQSCAALCEKVEAGELGDAKFVELFSAEARPEDLSLVMGCLTAAGVTKVGARAF